MYFVLYNRNLYTIGETYILESWSRIQRATDFDELNIIGEKIPHSANPFLVVVNNKQGKMMFSGLASTPIIDEKTNKTTISLKDYTTLFNTEVLVDWSQFSGTTLSDYLSFLFSVWDTQCITGLSSILFDVEDVSSILVDKSTLAGDTVENVLFYDLIRDAVNYYEIYCEPVLDLFKKTLTFVFKRANVHTASIRLSDFGVDTIEKSFGDYNQATIYNADYTFNQRWRLTKNNKVSKDPATTPKDFLYPTKNRNYVVSDSLSDAIYDAVMGLAKNRYQENIDLDVQAHRSVIDLTSVDFSWLISVYTDEGYYTDLPVGEIETNSKGKHIVRLGYRIQELTQEL